MPWLIGNTIVSPYTYAAGTATNAGTGTTWRVASTQITTGSVTSNFGWYASLDEWIGQPVVWPSSPPITGGLEPWQRWVAETAEQTARRVEAQRVAAEAARVRQQALEGADHRATELLLRFLADEQARQYQAEQAFLVDVASGHRYKLRRGNTILRLENGQPVESLCVHPTGVPAGDTLLAQKLWLETNEEELRRTANITRLRAA